MKIFLLFILSTLQLHAKFNDGEMVIHGKVYVRPSSVSVLYDVKEFSFLLNDDATRSKETTDWKVALKDKNMKILDSFFITFKEVQAPPYCPEAVLGGYANPPKERKPPAGHYPYDRSEFTFKYSPDAFVIEFYYKGELKASRPVLPPKKKEYLVIVVNGKDLNAISAEERSMPDGCSEAYGDQPVYRVVSLRRDGKSVETRFFNYVPAIPQIVTPEPPLFAGVGYRPWKDSKSFSICLRNAIDIEKVELYKGPELLGTVSVRKKEDPVRFHLKLPY